MNPVPLKTQLLFAGICVYTTQRANVWGSSEQTSELFAHFFQTELSPGDCVRVRNIHSQRDMFFFAV